MKEKIKDENGKVVKVRTINSEPSRTDPQYKDDCDANNIIRRFDKTGVITHVSKIGAQFADVSDIPDLLEGMERIEKAKQSFMEVPAKIRSRFDNDVSKFYAFASDPKNAEEMIKLGLKSAPQVSDDKPVAKAEVSDGQGSEVPKSSDTV